ncbi:MAG: hypothetical protein WD688_03275 [Candidatus Binatia bacterium]
MSNEHKHDHEPKAHGHEHGHSHEHKTRFHDPQHAAEFDRRSTMAGIRGSLTTKMIEMLSLTGSELVLDLATGTGRVARPVSSYIKTGHIVGVDQALAMLDVGHQHKEAFPPIAKAPAPPMLCPSSPTPSTGRLSPLACIISATLQAWSRKSCGY